MLKGINYVPVVLKFIFMTCNLSFEQRQNTSSTQSILYIIYLYIYIMYTYTGTYYAASPEILYGYLLFYSI